MPKVRFEIDIHRADKLKHDGFDEVEFLISANAGEPPMPMERIASGGELSRIMLALKSVLSDKDGVSTVVFDEVDAGISGKTSRKVGIKLKQIAKTTQVLCVTHSAQIASLADSHYLIAKHETEGRTETEISELDEEGRISEIARILGGIHVTESQLTAAKELIEDGKAI
jgi:DNA repair protein RecN (Recombination protein N)